MRKAVLVIGLVVVVWGLWIVVRPESIRRIIRFTQKGLLVYLPGLIRVILGVFFLLAAHDCRIKWIIAGFGVVMFAAGISMFMVNPSRLRAFFERWANLPQIMLRVLGLLGAGIGGLIAWAA